ncbi:MAG TPA: hypothetical protein VIB99_09130 [Candidatus Limnocylindrales bacterium]|jgi:hypothetical protein
MRLSGWQARAPGRDGLNPKVLEIVGTILAALGAEPDAHGWLTWADETGSRWAFVAPCPAGLAVVNVRAGAPTEGPRASGRLVRWSKVQVGELAVETERGHRLVMFQVEGQPIRGTDDHASDVAAFAALVLAGIDGRPLPDLDPAGRQPAAKAPAVRAAASSPTSAKVAKAAVTKAPARARGSTRPAPSTMLALRPAGSD